jgi:hypothetical protein
MRAASALAERRRGPLFPHTLLTLVLSLTGCRRPGEAPLPPRPAEARPAGCPAFKDISRGLPTSDGWRTNPALADVNGDGYLDLAATTRKGAGPKVFLFDPQRGWTDVSQGISLDHYPCGIGMELADVDGDRTLDLLAADHCTGLHLFHRNGQVWERFAHLRHPNGEGFNDAAAGDLDGDGRIDLVALGAFSTGLTLFMQERPGRFVHRETGLPRSGHGFDVNLADLDGDGRLDIYASLQGHDPNAKDSKDHRIMVWLQRPRGAWMKGSGLPDTGNYYGIASGDVNEDGLPDLVLSDRDIGGGVLIFTGTSRGAWSHVRGPPPGSSGKRAFAGVALSDLDGDGHLDLAAVERLQPSIVLWRGDGSGRFTECPPAVEPLPASLSPGWGLAVGDVDRDGRPDLVAGFGSERYGALKVWVQIAPHRTP